jgi:hypothetical protein
VVIFPHWPPENQRNKSRKIAETGSGIWFYPQISALSKAGKGSFFPEKPTHPARRKGLPYDPRVWYKPGNPKPLPNLSTKPLRFSGTLVKPGL